MLCKILRWHLFVALSPWSVESFHPASLVEKKHKISRNQFQRKKPFLLQAGNDDNNGEDLSDDFDDSSATTEDLDFAIDSFLRGDYERPFSDDAPAPHPGLTPQATVEAALRWLRRLDDPEPSHGTAVLLRFCAPLSRGERWGDVGVESSRKKRPGGATNRGSGRGLPFESDADDDDLELDDGGTPASRCNNWKEILRGGLTPTMLARRIQSSEFSCLLDWSQLDVTSGDGIEFGGLSFVNAALYYGDGVAPILLQVTLRRIHGVWLIDTIRLSPKDLFE